MAIVDEAIQVVGPECHTPGCRGYGDPSAGVVLIGIAPGQDEVRSGKPFTGPSGQLLDAVLKGVGWHRDRVYTTNLICFWKNAPDPSDLQKCRDRFVEEVRSVRPKLVIPLGNLAYETFSGKEMASNRGRPYWDKYLGAYVMGTYHPAAFLRGGSGLIVDIVKDLQKIPMILDWPKENVAAVRFTVAQSVEEAQAILDDLPKDSIVSLDIETNFGEEEIDIFTEEIVCVSVCWGDAFTAVFPRSVLHNLRWPTDVKWAFQNGPFDVNGLRRHYGVTLPITDDTLLQSYSLDERGGVHSLDNTAGEYCGAEHYKELFKTARRRGSADANMLYEYNAKDTAYTRRLVPIFNKLQEQDGVQGLYRDILVPLANIFADLSYKGILIDQEKIKELSLEWLPKWLEQEANLKAMAQQYGWPDDNINLASPKQLIKFLFSVLSLSMPPRYANQKPSTRQEILELLDHPFVDGLLDFRQLDHIVGNYVLGINKEIKLDGRVHPAVLIHGSRTGRPSYRNPPLQTIPQPYSVGADLSRIKEIFVADPGYVLLEADYKQIEVVLAAFLSNDPTMLSDLGSGDFHSSTAADVVARMELGPFLEELKKKDPLRVKQRFQAKKVTFGNFYRQGADSLSRRSVADCTIPQAQSMLIKWRARYRVYEAWADSMMQTAKDEGELVTVTGRKRRFRVVHGDDAHHILRQTVNFPIQSQACDYLLVSLIELYWKLLEMDARVLCTVHDSILFMIPEDKLGHVAWFIKEKMETPKWPGWPSVEVEMKVGHSWGAMSTYEV